MTIQAVAKLFICHTHTKSKVKNSEILYISDTTNYRKIQNWHDV